VPILILAMTVMYYYLSYTLFETVIQINELILSLIETITVMVKCMKCHNCPQKNVHKRICKLTNGFLSTFQLAKNCPKIYPTRTELQNSFMFQVVFMQNSSSTRGSMFSFSPKEDTCTFDFNGLKGTIDSPMPMGQPWQFVSVNSCSDVQRYLHVQ